MPLPSGAIVLAATPIGDTGDASARLIEALGMADVVAAEDTRRTLALCSRLGIAPPRRLTSLHEHNEAERAGRLVELAASGGIVLVVSDAGTPVVSDPGFRLARQAIAAGVRVTALPGPSAVLTALAVSGLPSDRFTFEGFPPRKRSARDELFHELAGERRTMVFFEAARRLAETLTAMEGTWGADRSAVVCRELTKVHEEVRRGSLGELAAWAADHEILGEVTLVVAGAQQRRAEVGELVAQARALADSGQRLKDVCRELGRAHGVSSQELYQAVLQARATS